MDDDQLDQRLSDAARAYHQPPETPREAMWVAMQRRRGARAVQRPAGGKRFVFRWVPAAVAAAAILATGVGIGRLTSVPEPAVPAPPVAAGEAAATSATAYRLAALEHLGQSEEFLTLFRTAVGRESGYRLASATARRLLGTNRLLLDSPAATDRRTRLLLQDLELVLAGIAQLSPQSPAQDLELVRDGIERGDVMPRLRLAVPAGGAPTQGAL